MHRPLSRQGIPLCVGTYPIPGRPLSIGVYGLLDRHRGVGVYAFSYRPLSDRGLSCFEQAATFLTLTPLMLGLSLCAAARDLWEIDGATLY